MKNSLLAALNKATNVTRTENGAITNKSTNSCVLDLFSQIGAYRSSGVAPKSRISEFRKSLGEDKLLTTKMLFWVRDVRGGQGERNVFRTFLVELASEFPEIVLKNLENIPFYGRWDDLFCLKGTSLENEMVALIKRQLNEDLKTDKPSLLGKWMPSINTSSKATVELAEWFRRKLLLSASSYRKMLTSLRKKIRVVEAQISRNKWSEVDYEKVPANASLKYRSAFKKHDPTRYNTFLNKVERGEAKINAATLYPYDISYRVLTSMSSERKALELLWKALPDYYNGVEENALVVCDTSGSMSWVTLENSKARPLDVALSLAVYIAERNKGIWHNQFMTFNTKPSLVKLKGLNLADKLTDIMAAGVGGSTDIQAVFDLILDKSIENNLTNEDLPKRIYIISDMEFNACTTKNSKTLFRNIQERYTENGYTMPQLVFWQVAARNVQFPMSLDDRGFLNVSGCNPSILKSLLKGDNSNAYQAMLDVLNDPRYNRVVI